MLGTRTRGSRMEGADKFTELRRHSYITIFKTIYVNKCPSSIPCRDSNPQPPRHESPPLTIRPVLMPMSSQVFTMKLNVPDRIILTISYAVLRYIECLK